MSDVKTAIRLAVVGHNPLLYLCTTEEDRVVGVLRELAAEPGSGLSEPRLWSCTHGLEGVEGGAAMTDPAAALAAVAAFEGPATWVFADLAPFMQRVEVARRLREFYFAAREKGDRRIVIIAPETVVPEMVRKEVHLIDVPPPDEDAIGAEIERFRRDHPDCGLRTEDWTEVLLALKGLTLAEVGHILRRAARGGQATREPLMEALFAEKEMLVRKAGYLEFCPPRLKLSDLGGLDNLKDWLEKRRRLFTREAMDAGVQMPKGLLMMGVSGCGKSLAVKVISSFWNLPLFRLDMNLIFSGAYGNPESAFRGALNTVESVAPAVLWIDEIENSLGMDEKSGVHIASHIFSAFLTWMQEKPPLVFIAATANRISALPAEIIRKGRFDQVFFLDLPADSERAEIFRIHLARNGIDLADVDMNILTIMTEGWNGAEIEQAVIAARVEAYYEKRKATQGDLSASIARIVPLSQTMEEQIKFIRSWAFSRAMPASKFGKMKRRLVQ